jgi:hypothetical protein
MWRLFLLQYWKKQIDSILRLRQHEWKPMGKQEEQG